MKIYVQEKILTCLIVYIFVILSFHELSLQMNSLECLYLSRPCEYASKTCMQIRKYCFEQKHNAPKALKLTNYNCLIAK